MQQILTVPSQIGPLLKAARKEARLSQTELARRVGISQSRMSELELNPALISVEQLLALFGALGLEVAIDHRTGAAGQAATQARMATNTAAEW